MSGTWRAVAATVGACLLVTLVGWAVVVFLDDPDARMWPLAVAVLVVLVLVGGLRLRRPSGPTSN